MSDPADPLSPPAPAPARPRGDGAALTAICLIVLVVYGRLLASDFTWWDDQGTIHHNRYFNPPSLASLRHHWTSMAQGLYVPVTQTLWTAIAAVANVGAPDDFGITLNPVFFHAANVACHAGSACLAFLILRRLLGGPSRVPALLGALLFAVHPVQVETVGWVSGMKDLLCWLGALAIVLLYVRRVQALAPGDGFRGLWASWEMPTAAALLALAILSKPTAMVAPAALLAIDGFALRRRWLAPLVGLLPLLAISAGGAAVARVAQSVGGEGYAPVPYRPLIVGDALCFYVGKLLWPATLCVDYGRTPAAVLADPWVYVRWLVPAGIAAALWRVRRRLPWLTLGGLVFVIGMAPVLGLSQFQMQRISTTTDHYLYFSMLGPAIVTAWVATRWPTTGARAAVAAIVVALGARAFVQTGTWHDTFALFEHALRVHPRSTMARNNLVMSYLAKRRPEPEVAERYADEARAIDPLDLVTIWNFSIAKFNVGKYEQSSASFEEAWVLADRMQVPAYTLDELAEAAYNSMKNADRPADAARWADRLLVLHPGNLQAIDLSRQSHAKAALERAASRPTTTVTGEPAPAPASAPSR